MKYPRVLEQLIRLMQKLPGVGRKTAERYAFDLVLSWQPDELSQLSHLLIQAKAEIRRCNVCGALTDEVDCLFCSDTTRTKDVLCIVSSPREIFHMEATREFRGLYHVLGGLLSPLDGRGEEVLELPRLTARLENQNIKEIVLALDSTLEGDTTALYLKRALESYPVQVSRLAFGIPVGSSLEYVDGGTLARAFMGRASF
ncbi:MAG TPA: recombination mediator RecR [Chlamydiales bacterium]|nr:recombination mediator RecR [Chlamydiales bacterium]